jgi:predicted Zn-dependent protease
MTDRVSVELIDALAIVLPDLVADARRLPRLAHADVRVEITEGRWASAVNGASRASGVEARLALGVRVLAGDRAIAPGHVGVSLGAADTEKVARVVRDAIAQAHRRAAINGEMKATTREKFGALGFALADTRLHSVDVRRDTVPAVYELDPRSVTLDRMTRNTLEVARDVATLDTRIAHSYLSTSTQLSRELFVSTEGAVLDQAFALTQGFAAVVAVSGGVSQAASRKAIARRSTRRWCHWSVCPPRSSPGASGQLLRSSGRSSEGTTLRVIASHRLPRAARTSGFPREACTRSGMASSASSSAMAG